MSTRSKRQRGREETASNTTTPTAPVVKKAKISKAASKMSATATAMPIPDALLKVYQQILPHNTEGIALLFSAQFSESLQVPAQRVAIQYGVPEEAAIEELRRLLAIKAFTEDKLATKISPTPLMDELWHAVILDTQLYGSLQEALGVLHHRPSGASDQESEVRGMRLAAMRALYTAFFSAEPLGTARSRPSRARQPQSAEVHQISEKFPISVRTLTGKTIRLPANSEEYIGDLKETIQVVEGIPPDAQRLVFALRQLEDEYTLADYNIGAGATLHLILRQTGC